jgi:hypothetical protein
MSVTNQKGKSTLSPTSAVSIGELTSLKLIDRNKFNLGEELRKREGGEKNKNL